MDPRRSTPELFDLSTADRIIEQFDDIVAGVGLVAIAISSACLTVSRIGVVNFHREAS